MPHDAQAQLDSLARRLESVESNQVVIKAQTDRIETNTHELIETFSALKGAWKVLDFLGKLAKPITFLVGVGGAWWWIKDHMKELFK